MLAVANGLPLTLSPELSEEDHLLAKEFLSGKKS